MQNVKDRYSKKAQHNNPQIYLSSEQKIMGDGGSVKFIILVTEPSVLRAAETATHIFVLAYCFLLFKFCDFPKERF